MRKRLGILSMVFAMTAALAGCGSSGQAAVKDDKIQNETETVSIELESVEETVATEAVESADAVTKQEETAGQEADDMQEQEKPAEEAGDDKTASENGISIPELSIAAYELPDSEALSFVREMKIGWNLGNTLDASSDTNKADELAFESDWCGIVTTKEMVDAVKEAGFNTLRVPVSWHNHVSDDGNYTISDVWKNRVQEVVDYAIDNDMYVIINIHHDNSTSYMYPSSEYLEQSKSYVKAIWTQVAARFAEYDEHLIMEGLNEPRLIGTNYEWWLDLNDQDCVDAVKCINELNQVFVDTVRAGGGNNAGRYLLVPGYCGSLQGVTNEYYELPQDIEGNENKILVEVHAYTPYSFALQGENESGSTDKWSLDSHSSTSEIDNLMDELYNKYTKQGIGVVIDEFGARDKGNNIQARTDYAAYYIASARARGITCCWWDNNEFNGSGENFGIFRRMTCEFMYPELVEGMMRYCE